MTIFIEKALEPLFSDVQLGTIFPDSKTFTDCIPRRECSNIVADYLSQKDVQNFDLQAFVLENFIIPQPKSSGFVSDTTRPIAQHIEHLWAYLTREPTPEAGTLIALPNRYVVPGGRFQEIYYWDSYFTMLGLQVGGHIDLIEQMADNFAYLIDTFGYIPNGNRTYFLGRSQPPFFALMVTLLAEEKGEKMLLKYQTQLAQEYAFWMHGEEQLPDHQAVKRVVQMTDKAILNRYWDENDTPRPESYSEDVELAHGNNTPELYRHIRAAAESGWDFSTRWFADAQNMATIETTHIIPTDLNCLLLYLEKVLLKTYQLIDNQENTTIFTQKIEARTKAIQQYHWQETDSYYFDYHWQNQKPTTVWSLAGVFPLFFEVATPQQAHKVAQHIATKFLQTGGLFTTLHTSGQQWDAPNGWSPLHWITYKGFKNYGFDDLANQIKTAWMTTLEQVYAATGKLTEKYNVSQAEQGGGGGEYPNQDGFGWTNGVYLKLKNES